MTIPTPPGAPFQLDTRLVSSYTQGSFEFVTYAWQFDLKPLLWSPDPRGEDTLIPDVDGLDPNPRRPTGSQRTLEFSMTGYVNSSGTPASDPWAQWATNWLALRAACDPISTGDGTIAASLGLAGGHTLTGPVTPLGIVISEMSGPVCKGQYKLSIPGGALA